MEFIQKKSTDTSVEHFLVKAADQEIPLAWDRYEGQLPVCGFCEAGLSCRDCLQGPCISHPFRDASKKGVCGKDKNTLAVQSLLRLVIKGTMSSLDLVADLANDIETGDTKPADKAAADKVLKEIQAIFSNKETASMKELPAALSKSWKDAGVYPEGILRDLFKASQKLEGGVAGVEETLLWAFKTALLGNLAQQVQRKLKRSVFGDIAPTKLDVSLGILQKDVPNIVLYGQISAALKQKIAAVAKKAKVSVFGVCTDPLLPPYVFSPVTNYGSQEIPIMTGAVDLIVAGDQFVNPSILQVAKDWKVTVVPAAGLDKEKDLNAFAKRIVDLAKKSFDNRADIPKDIPADKQTAIMGFSSETLDAAKVAKGLSDGKIKGVVVFSGSSNVKYSQDNEYVAMATVFLQNDILCISEGEASVALAKHGFLNPKMEGIECGKGLAGFLKSLGKNVPAVIDCNATEFILALAKAGKKAPKDYPVFACFPEANRSIEVVKAMGMVAMGVTTYFWPSLPVTGSPETMKALSDVSTAKFGAKLHVVTKKLSAPEKAKLFLNEIEAIPSMSGKAW
jgi:carbon-monoxide dehydrogenase catalytic subunit